MGCPLNASEAVEPKALEDVGKERDTEQDPLPVAV